MVAAATMFPSGKLRYNFACFFYWIAFPFRHAIALLYPGKSKPDFVTAKPRYSTAEKVRIGLEFVFIAVETEGDHLVMVHRLLPDDVWLGRECNAIAREHYRDCSEAGLWPKWSQSIVDLPLQPYARRRIESEINDHHN